MQAICLTMLLKMENRRFGEIKSLYELRCVRGDVEKRLQQCRSALGQNIEELRDAFALVSELLTLFLNSVSLLSKMFFLRRVYVWLRSVVRRFS